MKKIIICLLIAISVVSIKTTYAETTYKKETLKEACEKENLTCDFEEKEYNPSLPNIYVFRGDGCGYCQRLLSFLASIMDEYNKYVNVVVYEVGNDRNNWSLYEKVGAKFGKEVSGYPYMVIGYEPFDGYASSMDETIKKAIENLSKTEKYDVVEEVLAGNNDLIETPKKESSQSVALVFIFGVIATFGILIGYKIITKETV